MMSQTSKALSPFRAPDILIVGNSQSHPIPEVRKAANTTKYASTSLIENPEEVSFRKRIQQFNNMIRSLTEILEKNPEIIFLLVFDIDRTLLHDQAGFKGLSIKRIQQLQQQWFYQLAALKNRPGINLRLIYNTARQQLHYHKKINTRTWLFDENEGKSLSPVHHLLVLDTNNTPDSLCLPIPDAIITKGGGHIAMNPELTPFLPEGLLDAINNKLYEWSVEDFHMSRRLLKDLTGHKGPSVESGQALGCQLPFTYLLMHISPQKKPHHNRRKTASISFKLCCQNQYRGE